MMVTGVWLSGFTTGVFSNPVTSISVASRVTHKICYHEDR